MDYSTLAQLSNPGASPIKASGRYDVADPVAYARWLSMSRMQEESLKNALPLAAQNAQMQQQKTQEYMAGAPGRMDEVNLSNMKAKAGVANFDRDQAFEEAKKGLADAETRAKMADVSQDIAGDADAYRAAHERGDERLKNQIVQKNYGRKLRNGYVVGSDPNTDDLLFRVAGEARANAPALQNKLAVEDKKANTRISIENMKSLNQRELIELRGQIQGKLQGDRIAAARASQQGKPLSSSQALAAHLNGLYGNDHESWLNAYRLIQEASTTLKIDEKAAMLRMFPELAARMGAAASPRELPAPNPNVQAPATPAKKEAEHPMLNKEIEVMSKDPSGKETKYKATIIGVNKSGTKVNVRLPDGSTRVMDLNK